MVYAVLSIISLLLALLVAAMAVFWLKKTPVPSLATVFTTAGLAALALLAMQSSATSATEYLSYYYTAATYTEDWDEWVTKQCCTESCSGSGAKRTCTTTCVDCSHSEYHPPYWDVEDNAGREHSIDEGFYRKLVAAWGQETFQELNRNSYTNDGDRYRSRMPDSAMKVGSPALFGYTTTGSYKNKVRGSSSVFNYQEVDSADRVRYHLFPGTSEEPLQGMSDQGLSGVLRQANWLHGMQDQLHLSVMVFFDQPLEAAFAQEAVMAGGNKNEFTVILGLASKDSSILWVRPVSWTSQEKLKLEVRSDIMGMGKYDGGKIGMYLSEKVPKQFIRRQFAEFDYLPDTETPWMYLIALLLPLAGAAAGVGITLRGDF